MVVLIFMVEYMGIFGGVVGYGKTNVLVLYTPCAYDATAKIRALGLCRLVVQ